jgi:hypothetical protein
MGYSRASLPGGTSGGGKPPIGARKETDGGEAGTSTVRSSGITE